MKLTPLDIRKQEFKKVMRGYDPVEVDTFMDMVAREFEDLLKQQKEARDQAAELATQLKDYRQIEKTLQQTLLQAQETGGKLYENARKEAELILRDAEMRGAKILEQANADLFRLNNEIQELRGRRASLINRLRVLLSSELDLLKSLELGGDPVLDDSESHGTGKESIELEGVLKNLEDDGAEKKD